MHNFKLNLTLGEDTHSGLPVFGFNVKEMFIHNPFLSECGRFKVDPTATYFINKKDAKALVALNEMLVRATEDAVSTACFTVQKHLGIDAGDFAGVYFSGPDHNRAVAQTIAEYISREIERAANGLVG